MATQSTDSKFLFSGGSDQYGPYDVDNAGAPDASPPDPKVIRSRTATLNANRLRPSSGIGLNDRLVLNLFDDTVVVAVKDRIQRNASGSLTWIGHLEGIERSSVILIVRGDAMVAKIAFPGAVYEVGGATDGVHAIKRIDQSKLIDHETEVPEVKSVPDRSGAIELSFDVASDDGAVMDVLVVYSPEALAAAGSAANMELLIELAVAETNLAYESSDVSQRVDLVHMYASPDAQLSGFSENLVGLRLTSDGYLDDVHAVGDEYHADFVHLIIEDNSSCGLAYLQATPKDSAFETWAFGVVGRSCTTGSYALAHELGHNMGLRHDWYVDDDQTPHTWAHGFTNPPDSWITVMAYHDHCDIRGFSCTRLQYFSNPDNDLGGDATGVVGGTASDCRAYLLSPDPNSCDADNRSVLDSNAPTNAQFRKSQVTWLGNSTDWNNANNWTIDQGAPGSTTAVSHVPRSIDDVRIPAGPTGGNFPMIDGGTYTVRNVVIESGASLTMSGGVLNVHGHWEEQGSGSFNGFGGTLVFLGRYEQTIAAHDDSTFNDLAIGDGVSNQSLSLLSNLDVNGDLRLLAGAAFSVNTHTIEVGGDWDDQAGGFAPGTGRVVLDGGTQTVSQSTTRTLLDEAFDEADGEACCGYGSYFPPSGWVREQTSGFGFAGGTCQVMAATAEQPCAGVILPMRGFSPAASPCGRTQATKSSTNTASGLAEPRMISACRLVRSRLRRT